jgi:oligoribonuclease NrnB/cAMP/cGMP phosphodiesterase (DHH superfamily)
VNLKYDEFDILWVTDLNLRDYHIKILATLDCQKVIHFDHHIYEFNVMSLVKSYPEFDYIFEHDTSISSTLKVNRWLSSKFQSTKALTLYSEYVNSYDMWNIADKKFEIGYALNDLYWEYGSEKYFNKFKYGLNFDDEDKQALITINNNRNEYIEDSMNNFSIVNEEASVLYIFNPKGKYTNHFTIVNNYKYYVILKEVDNEEEISYSIRLRGDVGLTIQSLFDIIKKMGIDVRSSGGHKTVGSITFPKLQNELFLESINSIFEEQ